MILRIQYLKSRDVRGKMIVRRKKKEVTIQKLTIVDKRETVVFDTSLACGLYKTVCLMSDFVSLSEELLTADPDTSA